MGNFPSPSRYKNKIILTFASNFSCMETSHEIVFKNNPEANHTHILFLFMTTYKSHMKFNNACEIYK